MLVASNAFVASSCESNWMKAKFLLILIFKILPYGSKCLSKSLVLVVIWSKLITNKVFVGLILAEDLLGLPPPDRRPSRSCCEMCSQKQTHKAIYVCISLFQVFNQNGEESSTLPLSTQHEDDDPVCQTQTGQVLGLHPLHHAHPPCR